MDDGARVTSRPGMGKIFQPFLFWPPSQSGRSAPLARPPPQPRCFRSAMATPSPCGIGVKGSRCGSPALMPRDGPKPLWARQPRAAQVPSAPRLRSKPADQGNGSLWADGGRSDQRGTINLAMVQSGQAFVYRQYLSQCDRVAYLAAELQAQAKRLGVWTVPGGITSALGLQAPSACRSKCSSRPRCGIEARRVAYDRFVGVKGKMPRSPGARPLRCGHWRQPAFSGAWTRAPSTPHPSRSATQLQQLIAMPAPLRGWDPLLQQGAWAVDQSWCSRSQMEAGVQRAACVGAPGPLAAVLQPTPSPASPRAAN
jgi:hypothetical protein